MTPTQRKLATDAWHLWMTIGNPSHQCDESPEWDAATGALNIAQKGESFSKYASRGEFCTNARDSQRSQLRAESIHSGTAVYSEQSFRNAMAFIERRRLRLVGNYDRF